MFSCINSLLSCVMLLLYSSKTCTGELPPMPSLVLFMPGEPEFTDVLVRRVGDDMTLVCELRGDLSARPYVWNYIPENGTSEQRPYKVADGSSSSSLIKVAVQVSDSGQYLCSMPPFSAAKYIVVQPPGPKNCARGTFHCGPRCMAPMYMCDGYKDCVRGEDEAPHMCEPDVCTHSSKLNCSSGRCISESACCRVAGPLCQQPSCCDEYAKYSRLDGYDQEYPHLPDERQAPDDYGFIQSTIYTVTACALIFMIAVVLLVSAICKMHMKRAALRSYAHAERATRQHYTMQYAQAHRFPPCYEASRLLEQERAPSPPETPGSPARPPPQQCSNECPEPTTPAPLPERGGLARLSSIFSSRYRQVPAHSDVELTNVRPASLNNSPTRNRNLSDYRSPTYCDLNSSEFYFTDPDTATYGRDLNLMAALDYRPGPLDRVIDQLDRQRLTLQLGRFQLTIPRFGRRSDVDRRPDTPNVAEINIEDLDFVRMTSNDTYTLNGRTIRLLGADFENYPVLPNGTRPPPYNEAMRCKFFGPPPEYLSRDGLNARADEEARNNVEMPPCYDELASGNGRTDVTNNCNTQNNGNVTTDNETACDTANVTSNANNVPVNSTPVITVINTHECNLNNNNVSINAIIDNLPAIDSEVNGNE